MKIKNMLFLIYYIMEFMEKKKKIISFLFKFILILVWIYLLYNGNITQQRLIIFFLIIILGYIYTRFLKFLINKTNFFLEKIKKINVVIIVKILKILMIINIFKSFILFSFYYIDIFLFNFFSNLNYVFFKKNIISYFFIFIISNLIFNPIKLVIGYFYNLIKKWQNLNFFDLLFKRIEGLILSILIFTDIYNYLLTYTYIYLYIYIFLIFFCIFCQFTEYKKIYFYTCFLIDLNKEVTILGNFIRIFFLLIKILNINIDSIKNNYKYRYYIYIYDFSKSIDLEWERKKIALISNANNMINVVNKKPTLFLYKLLYQSLSKPGVNITNWKYYKNEKDAIIRNCTIKEIEILDYLYNFDLLRIKLLLFLIWEFEYYSGLNNIDNIKIVELFDSYILNFDPLLYDLDNEKKKNFLKKLNHIFLNIDNNLDFWNKWYQICESFLDETWDTPIENIYNENYYIVMDHFRLDYNIDRSMTLNKEEKEKNIKNWLNILISDLREEWKSLQLLNINKENYYWSILFNLEHIGLNKKKNER